MTILFMGGEMGAFFPSGAAVVEKTGGDYDSAFSRCAINIPSTADYVESADVITGTDLWMHAYMGVSDLSGSSTTNYRFRWVDGSGTEVIRLAHSYSSNTLTLQYLDNLAAWQTAGSSISVDMRTEQHIDLHAVVNSASGSLTLYLSGTKRIEGTGLDLAHITDLGPLRFYGGFAGLTANTYVSQVVVADESTIGMRVLTVPVTAAGASSDWIGAYSTIDEVVYDDADYMFSDTANDVSIFAHASTIPTGYTLRAFGIGARAKCGSGGPQNLQLALRASSTTQFSSSIALDAGYTANVYVWNTNPTTTTAWVNGDFTALQLGGKSIT